MLKKNKQPKQVFFFSFWEGENADKASGSSRAALAQVCRRHGDASARATHLTSLLPHLQGKSTSISNHSLQTLSKICS